MQRRLEKVVVRVPAKINIYLQAGLARDDGYHDLATVYQAVSVYDILSISNENAEASLPDGLAMMEVRGNGAQNVPLDGDNLVIKAARLLADEAGMEKPRARFHLQKSIPVEAGLGGGSADAAAALVGCNILWGLSYTREKLMELGARIGEDVPFLIHGTMAMGRGHRRPLESIIACGGWTWYWVLGVVEPGLATRATFAKLDELMRDQAQTDDEVDALYTARLAECQGIDWGRGRPEELAGMGAIRNDLEAPAVSLLPKIQAALRAGRAEGALASSMSGSGSTCVFLASDGNHADALAGGLRRTGIFRDVIKVVGPVPGAEVIESTSSSDTHPAKSGTLPLGIESYDQVSCQNKNGHPSKDGRY